MLKSTNVCRSPLSGRRLIGCLALGLCAGLLPPALSSPLAFPFETTGVVTGRDVTCSLALRELNEIVKKATGKAFRVGSGAACAQRIFLGRTAEAERALGADFFEGGKAYRSETSRVFSRDGDLYLVGSDAAGTLWAVYDFVEDSLGYRWYQLCCDARRAENEIVPKAERVVFSGRDTCRRPGFTGFRRDHENLGAFGLFRLRHRSNSEIGRFVPGYRLTCGWRTAGHGFDQFLPRDPDAPWMRLPCVPERVRALAPAFERHPEWFSVDRQGRRTPDMQLCLSSKATRDALWQSLLWWIEKNGPGTYMVASNDDHTGVYCHCPDCRALDGKYGGQCGALWDCLLDLCARLKKAGRKDVRLTSLAYRRQTQMWPGISFPDNFVCDYAPVTWDRSLSEVPDIALGDGRVYSLLGNCRDWCKACPGGVSYWYYGGNLCSYTWGRLQKEVRELYACGVVSVGLCGREGGYEFQDLTHHLWFRCLYSPEDDLRAEFARACRAKYGPAADEIVSYSDWLEMLRRRGVSRTPLGPGAIDPLAYATAEERREMAALHARAAEKAAGTKHAENVAWARMSLDAEAFLRDGDAAAEARARAASESYCRKVAWPKLMQKGNLIARRLDVMANYANLKSDALPPALAKYPRERVTRVLPPKSTPYTGYVDQQTPQKAFLTSEPDPAAVCGFALAQELPDAYAPKGATDIRVGLYDHDTGRYLIPFNDLKFPKGFWKRDEYRMFCLGRSAYARATKLIWTDVNGFSHFGPTPINTTLLERLHDCVQLDKRFETWISVKAQGPKFFPDDRRPNKIFIEQLFSVELGQ